MTVKHNFLYNRFLFELNSVLLNFKKILSRKKNSF